MSTAMHRPDNDDNDPPGVNDLITAYDLHHGPADFIYDGRTYVYNHTTYGDDRSRTDHYVPARPGAFES